MKSAALTHGSGPGSAIALSATSIRVRDAIIEKFIDKSLDELNNFLVSALDTEKDESKTYRYSGGAGLYPAYSDQQN